MNVNANVRPTQNLIEMALRELTIEGDLNQDPIEVVENDDSTTAEEMNSWRRSVDERALRGMTRVSSLENSLVEHISTSVPSLDEIIIRQRGRKKQPAKISWSPIKSPFKTPTKKSSTLHMSLLSPSPVKKLAGLSNLSTSMVLRNSPRKRLLIDTPNDQNPTTSSTPISTPTKRLKFSEDRPMSATNSEVPLRTLLKGLTVNQLTEIICGITSKDLGIERSIRDDLPLPDIRPFENELCALRKNITKSLPRSRLMIHSKSDGAAYSRASIHLNTFRK
jgi:Cut8, nuclear proteasome tether protein